MVQMEDFLLASLSYLLIRNMTQVGNHEPHLHLFRYILAICWERCVLQDSWYWKADSNHAAAVHGLFGCTSVVVVSQARMWISHFWEIPSFRATQETWLKPRTAPDIANFNEHVINHMQNGGPDIPGLRQFTAPGAGFDTAQKPVWWVISRHHLCSQVLSSLSTLEIIHCTSMRSQAWNWNADNTIRCRAIVTPRGATAGSWRYDPEVKEIKGVLNGLFPGSAPVVIDYEPRSDSDVQSNTASGKILFQFDPFQKIITDPNNPCEVYQQAAFRLWVEDRPLYVWQKYWAANLDQLITDFTSFHPLRKRDADPACQIPSSLVQASSNFGGQDMKSSPAPDPGETHWVTLTGSTRAATSERTSSDIDSPISVSTTPLTTTTMSSSTIVPSAITEPPTTTLPPSTSYPMVTYPCSTIIYPLYVDVYYLLFFYKLETC